MRSDVNSITPKIWHCHNARSLRPIWAMEEMGIDYDVEVLPFPPRVFKKDYLGINVLGTVPYFVHGEVEMTESTAICHYLVDRFGKHDFAVPSDHPEYGDFLNWLYHSDATLTFPQTLVLRYGTLESEERRLPQVVDDYAKWYLARLRRLDAHIDGREFLVDGRFTIADIAIGYALFFGRDLGLDGNYTPQVTRYLDRLIERPAFQRATRVGAAEETLSTG
ncbi:MAG: glutathione S-transferase family protein [Pseudomonadota bacterium]